MTITHRAFAESEHFSFEAFGCSKENARETLLEGLRRHAGQFDTAVEWPEEMLLESKIVTIGHGCSQFSDFDLKKVVGREILAPTEGGIGYRAMIEVRDAQGVFGNLDAYGATQMEANDILRRAVDLHQGWREDACDYIARILPEMFAYPIHAGAAYRGNLTGRAGERLL